MNVRFKDATYDRLETDPQFTGGWSSAVVRAYRSRLNYIRQAADERDFYAMKSLHFEKLQGREPERSMRLNDQWRLILEIEGESPNKTVVVLKIEDYH